MTTLKNKHAWSDLNYKKRKLKHQETERKLKKSLREGRAHVNEEKSENSNEAHSVSIAVPGSILDNAQSPELRTYLAGQIARAACIYRVDEVIVFNDLAEDFNNPDQRRMKTCEQLATILQYLECPQYLRKHLYPIQNSLKYAGVLNPLDAPHHLKKETKSLFREGVVLTLPPKPGKGSYVDVGLQKPVVIDKVLEPYFRVTVKLKNDAQETGGKLHGIAVSPMTPTIESGTYWGYTVRVAKCLNDVFTNCPYTNGYDVTIGTSDKGRSIDEVDEDVFDSYKHCLIVFGGLEGLEKALENDDTLKIDDVSLLFNVYVNVCPKQASRTIRTEEAILITLAELRKKIQR